MSLFVMTGATSGIGLQAAQKLLEDPRHDLIVGARNPSGAEALSRLAGRDRLTILPLDTSSLQSVAAFADAVKTEFAGRNIAALGLNAGMQPANAVKRTEDGFEESFAANYLGHYYLSQLLLPNMEKNGAIILTASGAHSKLDPIGKRLGYRGHLYARAEDVAVGALSETTSSAQNARDRYATSKFCLLLYAFSKAPLKTQGTVRLIAFDPGSVPGTQIVRDLGFVAKLAWAAIFPIVGGMISGFSTTTQSGGTLAKLMVQPDLAPQTGLHIDYRLKAARTAPEAHDKGLQDDLMAYSDAACTSFGQRRGMADS